MTKKTDPKHESARDRLLNAAYELFSEHGVNQVGIDAIIEKSGVAKASLYNNFKSKDDLVIAFLERREEVWLHGWLETEVRRRAADPDQRLLAFFDVFDGWFRREDFEGCPFISTLLDTQSDNPVHHAAAARLAGARAIVRGLAEEAGLEDVEAFARAWHILMKGAIIDADEGHRGAALDAKRAGQLILAGWGRK
jgi:AcrR family transcriptional regulator